MIQTQKTEVRSQKTEVRSLSSVVCCLFSVFLAGASASSEPPLLSSPEDAGAGDTPAVYLADASQDANATKISDLGLPIGDCKIGIEDRRSKIEIALRPYSDIARRLWQSTIGVPARQIGQDYKDQLGHLVEQVRSVKFRSGASHPADKGQTHEPVIEINPPDGRRIKPAPAAQDSKMPAAQKTESEPAEKQTQLNPPDERRTSASDLLPYEPVSQQTLQMLQNMAQDPNRVAVLRQSSSNDLSKLADILFLSGHESCAAVFYQQAIDRMDPNDVASPDDRAWILFQLGNCLSHSDLSAAKNAYRRFIAEYPDSLWTDLAKAREQLIDWYLKDKSALRLADKPLTLTEHHK